MLPSKLFPSLPPAGQAYAALFQLNDLLSQCQRTISIGVNGA